MVVGWSAADAAVGVAEEEVGVPTGKTMSLSSRSFSKAPPNQEDKLALPDGHSDPSRHLVHTHPALPAK